MSASILETKFVVELKAVVGGPHGCWP